MSSSAISDATRASSVSIDGFRVGEAPSSFVRSATLVRICIKTCQANVLRIKGLHRLHPQHALNTEIPTIRKEYIVEFKQLRIWWNSKQLFAWGNSS